MQGDETVRETPWLSSVLAAVVFWTALFAFGTLRPEYSQLTKAVSELGAVGAPNALAWNLIGFIVPGLLIARSGAWIAGARGALWWFLVLSGIAFAGTGVFPAVVRNGTPVMLAPLTLGHVAMLLLSSVCWLIGAVVLVRCTWRDPDGRHARVSMIAFTLVTFAGLAANVFHEAIPWLAYRPGLAQRLGLLGLFAWYVAVSARVRTT